MKVFKSILLISMALLTFTVIIYDNRVFFNPPKALNIVVIGETYHESWTMEDITNHPLKERIMSYVNMSIARGKTWKGYLFGEQVYIVNDPEVEEFFGKYYVSSWCGTCNMAYLKDGDTYYCFMVGYTKVRLSLLEYYLAWIVSIATVILWIFTVSTIQPKKEVKT